MADDEEIAIVLVVLLATLVVAAAAVEEVVVAVVDEEESCKKENTLASVGFGKLRRAFSAARRGAEAEGRLPLGPRRLSGGMATLVVARTATVVVEVVAVAVEGVVECLCSSTGDPGDELIRDLFRSNNDPRFSCPRGGPVGGVVLAVAVAVAGEVDVVEMVGSRVSDLIEAASALLRIPNGEFLRS